MMDGRFHSDFRQSLDESADEIAAETVDDMPASENEVRETLPEDTSELPIDEVTDHSLRTLLAESPVGRYLERARQ